MISNPKSSMSYEIMPKMIQEQSPKRGRPTLKNKVTSASKIDLLLNFVQYDTQLFYMTDLKPIHRSRGLNISDATLANSE